MVLHQIVIPYQMPVEYACSLEEADRALRLLSGEAIGIDLEWKPNFVKGAAENPTATVQLCDGQRCVVIHVRHMRTSLIADRLRCLLTDPKILKVGQGFDGQDRLRLSTDFGIENVGPVVDCIELAHKQLWRELEAGVPLSFDSCNLRSMASALLQFDVPRRKKTQMSNWNVKPLTSEQLTYAAEDAALTWYCWRELSKAPESNLRMYPLYVCSCSVGHVQGPLNATSESFVSELSAALEEQSGQRLAWAAAIVPSVLMGQSGVPSAVFLCSTEGEVSVAQEQVVLTGLAACSSSFAGAVAAARSTRQAMKIKKGFPDEKAAAAKQTSGIPSESTSLAAAASAAQMSAFDFEDSSCVAFATGVPKGMADYELLQCFQALGCDAGSVVLPFPAKGQHMNRGYGFIVFQSPVEVQEAIIKSPYLIQSNSVTIREYKERSPNKRQ